MAEPRARAAAAAPDFTELWRRASALSDDTHERTSTMLTGLQSPPHRSSRYAGCSSADSPGDAEPTQDIFWDPTSPPAAAAGFRNSRFVEISDIVNRIAPKDVKRKACDSPLLQWIGDSAVPFTQSAPKPRARRRSSRPSSVDDLLVLARQFDENMQQDRETSERLAAGAPEPEPRPADARSAGDLKAPPSTDPVEAELRALFDCSTQRVSGRLSQGSPASAAAAAAASARSQETERRQPEPQPEPEPEPEPEPAEGRGPCGFKAVACDDFDFDDDWDDDDLLDDSFALAASQAAAAPREAAEASSGTFTSVCEPSALRALCPEVKTSNRSTFKLEPNPHFQTTKAPAAATATTAATTTATTAAAAAQPKPKPAAVTTRSIPIPVSSDSLWDDDGVDDALLYQACDRVERSSQPLPREEPAPPPAHVGNAGQSPRAFGRSNSLPGGSGEAGSHQGWGATLKGGGSKAGMSQSLPGSRLSLGSFNRCRDAAGPVRAATRPQPHTASCEPHQPAAKRGAADAATVSSKVFVASQKPMKCSAAEIGRKKQEALARRRLRLQSATKP